MSLKIFRAITQHLSKLGSPNLAPIVSRPPSSAYTCIPRAPHSLKPLDTFAVSNLYTYREPGNQGILAFNAALVWKSHVLFQALICIISYLVGLSFCWNMHNAVPKTVGTSSAWSTPVPFGSSSWQKVMNHEWSMRVAGYIVTPGYKMFQSLTTLCPNHCLCHHVNLARFHRVQSQSRWLKW